MIFEEISNVKEKYIKVTPKKNTYSYTSLYY